MTEFKNPPCDWSISSLGDPTMPDTFVIRESGGKKQLICTCWSREMALTVLNARREELRCLAFERHVQEVISGASL